MASAGPSGAPAQRFPCTKFLVVCGASTVKDSWLFGNFLGFCRALQSLGVNGEFWSCFPVREYFDTKTQYNDIKFGGYPGKWEAVEVYTRRNWSHRETFWIDRDIQNLAGDAIRRVVEIGQDLVAGDIFNIILIGHGNTAGVALGRGLLCVGDLANALTHLKPHVRVNVVIQSCHSGIFADAIEVHNQPQRFVHTSAQFNQSSYPQVRSPSGRYRNSRFSGAFLRSLGFAHDQHIKDQWSPQSNAAFVAREGAGGGPNSVQHYQSLDVGLISRFISVLFTDYVDLSFSQSHQAARRVITPPNPALREPDVHMETRNLQVAERALEHELSLIEDDPPDSEDMRIVSDYYETLAFKAAIRQPVNPSEMARYQAMIASQFHALRWRFRIQEPFWIALEALANKDLINQDLLLSAPITWIQAPMEIHRIFEILRGFELIHACLDLNAEVDLEGSFKSPVLWLAAIIYHCCTDIHGTLTYLVTSRIFGNFDESCLQRIPGGKVIYDSRKSQETRSVQLGEKLPAFAFWLPQTFNDNAAFGERLLQRYSQMVRVYENCFGQGSWGDWSDFEETMKHLGSA